MLAYTWAIHDRAAKTSLISVSINISSSNRVCSRLKETKKLRPRFSHPKTPKASTGRGRRRNRRRSSGGGASLSCMLREQDEALKSKD